MKFLIPELWIGAAIVLARAGARDGVIFGIAVALALVSLVCFAISTRFPAGEGE